MPSPSVETWVVKPGWEHRAFLGLGPVTVAEFEAHAESLRWSADELDARKLQAYQQGTTQTGKGA